jgi:hypothetical protein
MRKKATPEEMEYWRKVARDSAVLDRETPRGTRAQRERVRRILNSLVPGLNLPPVRDWLEEEPPELEFYRIAKARGLIRRPDQRD